MCCPEVSETEKISSGEYILHDKNNTGAEKCQLEESGALFCVIWVVLGIWRRPYKQKEVPFFRRGLLCQALVRERFLAWKDLMTFRRVNSSRSFSSSASVMKRMVSLKPGMTMFFRALARFCVFLMAVARR